MLSKKTISLSQLIVKKTQDLKNLDPNVQLNALLYFDGQEEVATGLFDKVAIKEFIKQEGLVSLAKLLKNVNYKIRYLAACVFLRIAKSDLTTHSLILEATKDTLPYLIQDKNIPSISTVASNIVDLCHSVFESHNKHHEQLREKLWNISERKICLVFFLMILIL